jgi:hypothetical protein
MALDCPADGKVLVDDIVAEINNKEDDLGLPANDNEFLSSLTDGTRIWAPVTSAEWGNITGTLSNQTDLQTELDTLETEVNTKVTTQQENSVGTLVQNMLVVTQAEYDGLTPLDNTFYIILV